MTKARDLANGATALSAVSPTELGYLDGVTSALQTQLDNKTGGKILQVVNATLATTASTTSSTLVDTGLEATITPTLSTSKILVTVSVQLGVAQGAWTALATLCRGATNLLTPTSPGSRTGAFSALPGDIAGSMYVNLPAGYTFLDSPASTSALTYKVRYSCPGGTAYINRSAADADNAIIARGVSTITLMEIAA